MCRFLNYKPYFYVVEIMNGLLKLYNRVYYYYNYGGKKLRYRKIFLLKKLNFNKLKLFF